MGVVAAGALSQSAIRQAKADHHGPGIFVDFVNAHRDGGNITAILGNAPSGFGVVGEGKNGVTGISSTYGHAAVVGRHDGTYGYGVVGEGRQFQWRRRAGAHGR